MIVTNNVQRISLDFYTLFPPAIAAIIDVSVGGVGDGDGVRGVGGVEVDDI